MIEEYVEAKIKIEQPYQEMVIVSMKNEGWELVKKKKGEIFLGLATFYLTFGKILKL